MQRDATGLVALTKLGILAAQAFGRIVLPRRMVRLGVVGGVMLGDGNDGSMPRHGHRPRQRVCHGGGCPAGLAAPLTMTAPLPDRVALGTMHGKEAVIAPPLAALGVTVVLAEVETDRFGTFSGDVPRAGSMIE